jgi:uncharacterized membrane protein
VIALPAATAVIAALCAAFVGWDALKRPSPERVIWAVAFLLFTAAAVCEVVGAAIGWSPALARIYYLAGAVLVVGVLALGELYLLLPRRMPAITPGVALLIVAVAVTAVWSAPIDPARLSIVGWQALERGPFLVALAATINAGGTIVLAGGALYSAWKLRAASGSGQRAAGCVLIAVGTITVALGGTLTRFGRPEFLYLTMALGIAIIFAGVVLTRQPQAARSMTRQGAERWGERDAANHRARLIPLSSRSRSQRSDNAETDEGIRFVVERFLSLDDGEIAEACRRWSATPVDGDAMNRLQAQQVWTLRLAMPERARTRFDALPIALQAQLAEIYTEVWSAETAGVRSERRA